MSIEAIQQAEVTGEPVYQICKKDSQSISSAWIDVEKQVYEDAGIYPEYGRRTLYTHPAQVVPDGWKLVPIEPTAEMLQAALKVATPGALRAAWARMLAASPAQKGD